MYERRFSDWVPWSRRDQLRGIRFPGVYAIARSRFSMTGKPFEWRRDIIYIGMTNAIAGLKGRLDQFDLSLSGPIRHGGADRVRNKYRNRDALVRHTYVAVAPFRCDVQSIEPRDLRVMGDIARFEYQCFAEFVRHYGVLPEFNDKRRSPKYSASKR